MAPRKRQRHRRKKQHPAPAPKGIDWNGHPKLRPLTRSARRLRTIAAFVLAHEPRACITSTHDGSHAYRSLHGQWSRFFRNWRALDFGAKNPTAPDALEVKEHVQKLIYQNFPHEWFAELFGPINSGWIRGGRVFTEPEGAELENQHDTHVHAGI